VEPQPTESELHIHLNGGYTVTRLPAVFDPDHRQPSTYVLHRPDGTELGRHGDWLGVERALADDRSRPPS
jgi:hypothetical protein